MARRELRADAVLFLVAAIWGSAFVAQRLGMDHVGPMTFNAIRFAIGLLMLLGTIWCLDAIRQSRPKDAPIDRPHSIALGGGFAGLILFAAAAFQQAGLVHTTAGKAGFITGLSVVFVPLIGLLMGRRLGGWIWLGVLFAAVGLYFLSVAGSFEVNRGDLLVLVSAVFWALHVVVIGRVAGMADPLKLAAAQFAVVTLFAMLGAVCTEELSLSGMMAAKWALLYGGVLSIGIACTLQIIAQRHAPPTHAAIIFSLEVVFAAFFGWLFLHEILNNRQLLGCSLMLIGTLVSKLSKDRPKQHDEHATPTTAQKPDHHGNQQEYMTPGD